MLNSKKLLKSKNYKLIRQFFKTFKNKLRQMNRVKVLKAQVDRTNTT
jgi:hypothetical protein